MSTLKTYNIDSGDVTNLTVKTNGTAALTINGSTQNVGIGTNSPNYQFQSYKVGAVANYLQVTSGATGTASNNGTLFGVDASGNGIVNVQGAVNYITSVAGVERMRIDSSGNVGIGTSLPLAKLDVRGNAYFAGNGTSRQSVAFVNTGGSFEAGSESSTGGAIFTGSSAYSGVVGTTNATPLQLGTNAIIRATLDTSGFTQFSSNNVMPYQGAPTSKAAATTLTASELITGILNTTGTTYTITLPTGTNIEGALTWSANNVCLDWFVINTASGTITIGANGNTTLGSLTVATGVSAQFRIRRTAANTFTVYRLG
jgi:hypothetical protein